MTTTRHHDTNGAQVGLRWTLSWLLIALFSTAAWSQGGAGSGSDPSDSNNNSSPGEEITGLPMLNDAPGLTLVGGLRELRAVGISVRGRGQILLTRLGRNTFALTFSGDYRVELDRRAVARSGVAMFFHGGAPFHGGLAVLQIGSSTPVLLGAESVQLPVARLAASPRALGDLVTMDASGNRMHQAHIVANFGQDRITLSQLLR